MKKKDCKGCEFLGGNRCKLDIHCNRKVRYINYKLWGVIPCDCPYKACKDY